MNLLAEFPRETAAHSWPFERGLVFHLALCRVCTGVSLFKPRPRVAQKSAPDSTCRFHPSSCSNHGSHQNPAGPPLNTLLQASAESQHKSNRQSVFS